MTFINRMSNAGNRYQTNTMRVLCLGGAGLLRSPTTANVLHQDYGYNTRAAGVYEEYALIFVDRVLIEWADQIVCVEPSVRDRLLGLYHYDEHALAKIQKSLVVLNVPGIYKWGDEHLKAVIREQYSEAAEEN